MFRRFPTKDDLVAAIVADRLAQITERARSLANDPQLRWLGPEKGVIHLALAAIVNAIWDLWARSERNSIAPHYQLQREQQRNDANIDIGKYDSRHGRWDVECVRRTFDSAS